MKPPLPQIRIEISDLSRTWPGPVSAKQLCDLMGVAD
jgi:hypothetical protein